MKHVRGVELSKLEEWRLVGDEDDPFVPEPVEGKRKGYRDYKQSRGHTRQDLNLLRKRRAELTKVLNRVPWKFRFYFFVQPVSKSGAKGPSDTRGGYRDKSDNTYFMNMWDDKITEQQARKAFKDYGEPFPKKWKDSINVIHSGISSPQEGNLPPSPWMVIHRLAHPVLGRSMPSRGWGSFYGQAWKDFIETVYMDERWMARYGGLKDQDQALDLMEYNKLVETMFTFRSARLSRIESSIEAIHEIFTDFIYKGGKLGETNPPPRSITKEWGTEHMGTAFGSDKEIELAVRKLKRELKAGFVDDLNKAVGQWYYT